MSNQTESDIARTLAYKYYLGDSLGLHSHQESLVHSILKTFFKLFKCNCVTALLFSNMRRIYVVKYGYNYLFVIFPAVEYMHKLIQAPRGRRIIFRENDY
ncbi:hypothetical protein PanWU01x14_197400 [Parasponia andersonii]|uniref:Uncharacterized protein n=1 Tax=Parasponia andersonii TaxID=3476 RepID=A0A2P5BZJ5_PARAD|nr:hypothetical protein PanWU01x14_197400 [Parasponia andersonii]